MSNKNYIHPAQKRQDEHEKRKEKKKKKRGLIWFLLILLLLAALLGGIGWGQGWFDGKGKSEDTDTSGSDSQVERTIPESQADESSEARTPVALKISGSSYIYNDNLRTLEQLKGDLAVLDKNGVIIEITDDNAVANAMKNLHDLLNELGLAYSDVPSVTTTTAAADSSAAETTTTAATTAAPVV